MIMWIMSDRNIPRSFRMIEGFGVHSALLDKAGVKPDAGIVAFEKKAGSSFVKAASGGRIWTREPAVRKVY